MQSVCLFSDIFLVMMVPGYIASTMFFFRSAYLAHKLRNYMMNNHPDKWSDFQENFFCGLAMSDSFGHKSATYFVLFSNENFNDDQVGMIRKKSRKAFMLSFVFGFAPFGAQHVASMLCDSLGLK